jgi:hypothetical protein
MAQTIAMQRGTSTVASNATTTLWTQSGGTATRVIFNGMAFKNSNTNVFSYYFIYVVPSGGAPYVIQRGLTDRAAWQISPSYDGYGILSNTNQFGNMALFRLNTASTYPADSTSPNGVLYIPDGNNNNTGIPLNFWIGPSDVIKVTYAHDSGNTATFGWSFTTITES